MTSAEVLAKLKATVAKMTPGPWHTGGVAYHRNPDRRSTGIWGPIPAGSRSGEWIARDIDCDAASAIAALRNHADALIEIAEAAVTEVERVGLTAQGVCGRCWCEPSRNAACPVCRIRAAIARLGTTP